jgi:three-Cys-motif partner protein
LATKNRNERQFDQYREWQWCKHTALTDYIVPWSSIVGSTAKEIYVADMFAGAGTYREQFTRKKVDGSPVIFAARARKYMADHPAKRMHVICVERNGKNFAALKHRLAEFDDCTTVLKGDFVRHRDAVLTKMGTHPSLLLLDPIGLKTIPAEVCAPLLHRIGKTDVFIVLHFKIVHRTGGKLLPTGHANPAYPDAVKAAETLDAVFGSPRWRFVAVDPTLDAAQRERKYKDLYFEDVLGGRFDYRCAFEVRRRYKSAVQYWLVHASNHEKAFELMYNEIVKLNELLLFRDLNPDGSIPGLAEWELDQHRARELAALEHAVFGVVASAAGQVIEFGALRTLLLDDFFGRVKWGAYSKAVKNLVKADRLLREERKAAAMREDERLRLPPSAGEPARTATAGGGTVVPIRAA